MAFETTICQECPTPIQWPTLRAAYLRCINIALDTRDAMLKDRDARISALEAQVKALTAERATCDPMKCNPICLRCGDTPSCGDGSWSWMDGVHRHRCRDLHPQCGHDRVPCENHQPGELIALLRDEVKALVIVRNTKNAEVDRLMEERDAQAEAAKSACRMAYRASYLGFDHAWGDSQISCIKNKIVRETMQDIARAAVERGAEG